MTTEGPSEAFFRDLERTRLRALVDADVAGAHALHAPEYQLVTPGGMTLSRDAYLGDIESGALRYEVFEPATDIAVLRFESGAAVRYQARITVRFGSGASDQGRFWHTDVYARRDGRWLAMWSQATRIPA